MKATKIASLLMAVLMSCSSLSFAQYAPGEDPLVLSNQVTYNMMPLNNQRRSGDMDKSPEMPSWLRAKLSRYQAKAFAAENQDVATDADVITTEKTDGVRKTCIQEVGSNTQAANNAGNSGFNRYGPKPEAQVVVLRGDLVNICN
ncbi:hypothetical protein [Hydrogenophaga sp. 5NK40-0174]|uniref:hypothetical protein n=1 Tax=Hydrogenophaga sp. 5NK40-0174 TaxID=3127649 RepID=UPI003106AE01